MGLEHETSAQIKDFKCQLNYIGVSLIQHTHTNKDSNYIDMFWQTHKIHMHPQSIFRLQLGKQEACLTKYLIISS